MANTTPTRRQRGGNSPDLAGNGRQTVPPSARARLASSVPGRLRVRLQYDCRHVDVMDQVEAHLNDRTGIHDVMTNTTTGSVVVRYDPERHTGGDVLAMLRDVGIIVADVAHAGAEALPEVDEIGEIVDGDPTEIMHTGEMGVVGPREHSAAATSVVGAVGDLNTRIARYTGGVVDLKVLFPIGLGAVGVFKVLRDGFQITEVPAYVLLWYAFDAFHKFHRPHVLHVSHPAPRAATDATATDTFATTPAVSGAPVTELQVDGT